MMDRIRTRRGAVPPKEKKKKKSTITRILKMRKIIE